MSNKLKFSLDTKPEFNNFQKGRYQNAQSKADLSEEAMIH